MDEQYDEQFFEQLDGGSVTAAREIAPIIVEALRPASVLDVGSGRGGWAAAFAGAGVSDFLCIDGDYVDRNRLHIPVDRFRVANLAEPLELGRRFDLAICVEVGEHLPESAAGVLVDSIARHADAALFSAAIPLQNGTNHINRQWPAYWASLFAQRGYSCFDYLRWEVWERASIPIWYRQNCLLYLNAAGLSKLPPTSPVPAARVESPVAVVHPEFYLWIAGYLHSLTGGHNTLSFWWAARATALAARAGLRRRIQNVFPSLNRQKPQGNSHPRPVPPAN